MSRSNKRNTILKSNGGRYKPDKDRSRKLDAKPGKAQENLARSPPHLPRRVCSTPRLPRRVRSRQYRRSECRLYFSRFCFLFSTSSASWCSAASLPQMLWIPSPAGRQAWCQETEDCGEREGGVTNICLVLGKHFWASLPFRARYYLSSLFVVGTLPKFMIVVKIVGLSRVDIKIPLQDDYPFSWGIQFSINMSNVSS